MQAQAQKLTVSSRVRLLYPIYTVNMQLEVNTMATVMKIVTDDTIIVMIDQGTKFECSADLWEKTF